ncbi:MAG: hypothetical protein AAF420_04315 [Pseudomonadota bacterium]
MYIFAAVLLVLLSIAHSYLGERYILIRLFRRDNLPKLFGSTEFTVRTLRFAWHLTSVAWLGFAVILIQLGMGFESPRAIAITVGVTFVLHGLAALIGSKGKHLSWPFFLIAGTAAIYTASSYCQSLASGLERVTVHWWSK